MIPDSFGEPTFPPPREGTGTGRKTRKSKGKLRKQRKELEAAKKAETNNQNNGNPNDINKAEEPSQLSVVVDTSGGTEGLKGSGNLVESKSDKNKNCDAVLKDTEQGQAKKPRVRENPWDPLMPSFRVTCNRNGDVHNFDSMTAAANFGGAIYNYYKWNVKMTEFDIEVILGIEGHEVTVSLGLTKESLHRRNITHFGPTTLRPTIAYSMLRFVNCLR